MTDPAPYRPVTFGTPGQPGIRLADMDGYLKIEQRPDGTFLVTILCRGHRGGKRTEAVILDRRRARLIVNQWASLLAEEDR